MATKEKLLSHLEAHKGTYFSGEEIAQALGVSRTSVWKAVKALQAQGYAIDAVTNRGYCLSPDTDVLSVQGVEAALHSAMWRIHLVPTVESTNSAVRTLASQGEPEGYVLLSETQTGGRGRMGRTFFSPRGTGLYLSFLLRPRDFSPDQALQITTAAASAMCLAIESVTGLKPGIKWVNDIFLDGRKICGILTEASFSLESGSLESVVVGLGINLYPPKEGFPPELSGIAGALRDRTQSGLKNELTAAFLDQFARLYEARAFREAAEIYRSRSILIGKEVLAEGRPARVLDINDRCQLVVRLPEGDTRTLSYGEVQIVNLYKNQ